MELGRHALDGRRCLSKGGLKISEGDQILRAQRRVAR
jgi:hypothetical protein